VKTLRATIKGWTASWRFPFLAVVQPTLPVPAPSTIYGILSAVAGKPVGLDVTLVGFVASSHGKAEDLEWIYQVGEEGKIEKTNVIKREFLYAPELYLYTTNLNMAGYFDSPCYPLLLGRSCDLARLVETRVLDLSPVEEAEFRDTLLPYPWAGVAAPVVALPMAFTDTVPRKAIAVRPFYIIGSKPMRVRREAGRRIFLDPEKGWGVYFHGPVRQG